jgi:VWFA-related protein
MNWRSKRIATGLLLGVVAIWGQPPAKPTDVVIRTTTSLVEARVVATDSAGHTVADLRPEEFHIFDNGKPRPLKLFSPSGSISGPPSANSTPAPGQAEPAPPGYAVVLLDWLNTGYDDRLRVQEKVLRLLKNYEPHQKLGIYVLSQHSHLLIDFTSDRDILAALVERMDLDSVATEFKIWTLELRVKETVRTVNLLADHLLHVAGRKSLIWLTSGFPMLIQGPGRGRGAGPAALFFQDVEKSLAKLNAADIAIYSIDAAGFRILPDKSFGFDTTREISRRTGGTAFSDRNDLDEGVRLALEDAASSYTLGFHAPDDARPGLHAIDVRVDRREVKLRYRETYDPRVAGR